MARHQRKDGAVRVEPGVDAPHVDVGDQRAVAMARQAVAPLAETQVPAPAAKMNPCTGTTGRLSNTLMRSTISAVTMPRSMSDEQRDERIGSVCDLMRAHQPEDGVSGSLASLAATLFFAYNDMLRRSLASDTNSG
jgi:hypothetical protein